MNTHRLFLASLCLALGACQDFKSPMAGSGEPHRPAAHRYHPPHTSVPPTLSASAVPLAPAPPTAGGQSALRPLRISEAIDIALRDNLDLALARAEQQVIEHRARGSSVSLLPAVQVGAGASRTDGQVQGSFGDLRRVEYDTFDSNLSLVYRLNIGAQVNDAIAARRELDAAVLETLSTRQRLMLRITELYYDLVLTRVGVTVADDLLRSSRELFDIAGARSRGGVGSGSDVARTDARIADAQRQLIAAQTSWKQASIRLATALRLDPAVSLAPEESRLAPWQVAPDMADDGFDPSKAAENRPDVQAARHRIEAAQQRLAAAQWDMWGPEVVGRVEELFVGDSVDRIDDRQRYGLWVGWTLSLEKLTRIDQRRAEEVVSRLRNLRARDQAAAEVQSSLTDIRAAAEQIPLAQRELDAARTTLRLNTARFKGGTALAVEFIDAQDTVTRATLNLARAIAAYNVAQVRLLAAAGVLDRPQLPDEPGQQPPTPQTTGTRP